MEPTESENDEVLHSFWQAIHRTRQEMHNAHEEQLKERLKRWRQEMRKRLCKKSLKWRQEMHKEQCNESLKPRQEMCKKHWKEMRKKHWKEHWEERLQKAFEEVEKVLKTHLKK